MSKPNPSLVLLLLLGACATDPELGATVNHNIVAQVVDMNPEYAGVPMEGSNGKRGVASFRRYQSGNVRALQRVDGGAKIGQQGGAENATTAAEAN